MDRAYDVEINGTGYLIDWNPQVAYRQADFADVSVPLLRTQSDTSNTPGQQSLNPDALWPRIQDTWHKGAGQAHLDRADSDPARFRDSHGINPWTKWELSLLPDTRNVLASSSTSGRMHMTVCGDYVYAGIDTSLSFASDITGLSPTWTTVSTATFGFIDAITSDGETVYVAPTAGGGVYSTAAGSGTIPALYNSQNLQTLAYVKGRLVGSSGPSVYNITGPNPTAPTLLLHHSVSTFKWVAFSEGPGFIYAGGYGGDKSQIYKTAVKTDGTSLDAMTVAGELPDGELIRSLQGYLGYLCIGSDKGMRLASFGADGNLTIGPLISTPSPVLCFEGQDRFVWYGNSNITASTTGLGRADLSVFNENLQPAYANDIAVAGQGIVRDIATFQGLRLLAVDGHGIYVESTSKVPSGTLDTGEITFGLSDAKNALFISDSFQSMPVGASASVQVAVDGGTLTGSIGSPTVTVPRIPITPAKIGERFEVRHTLNRGTDVTTSPVLTRYTLEALPAPNRPFLITLPLRLDPMSENDDGEVVVDTQARRDELRALLLSQQVVPYREYGGATRQIVIVDAGWYPTRPTGSGTTGTIVVKLKEIS